MTCPPAKIISLKTTLGSGVIPHQAKLKQQIVGKQHVSCYLLRVIEMTEESKKPSDKPSTYLNLAATTHGKTLEKMQNSSGISQKDKSSSTTLIDVLVIAHPFQQFWSHLLHGVYEGCSLTVISDHSNVSQFMF